MESMFRKMLTQVRRIPRGKVATYGDVAYAAGFPGAARQVAWALHAGHIDVPWQRVVGAEGKILLTGEHGFEQRMRLQSEGVQFVGLRVDMRTQRHAFFGKSKGSLKVEKSKGPKIKAKAKAKAKVSTRSGKTRM